MKQRTNWIALFAFVLLFACKGESPTAPPPGSGGQNPGPTPQPTGVVNLVITASSTEPAVDGTVTITASVTQDGQPAPNGTAVEFTASGGGLDNTTFRSLIKTTNNGLATVQLTSTTAGPITVTAVVGNVSRSVVVTFRTTAPPDQPQSTAPTISAVSPAIGRPSGGEIIRITGTNFRGPLRVLFNVGQALPVEATIVSSTLTTIDVITPGVNLGAGQQLETSVIVLTQVGTANEQRAELQDAFTFRNEQLTPRFSTASPNSGPVTGGTRVTIFGDGFQAPVQVLFGLAEARVITVDFNQIIVEAPAGRDTSETGSGTVVGPVPITIRNINSQTAVTTAGAFRYVAAMDITNFRPIVGPSTGGTDVVIDGIGFVAPVDVNIAGIRATVLQVTGTRILARTGPLPSSCNTIAGGTVMVTNANNGDHDIHGDQPDEESFTYIPVPALITEVDVPNTGAIPGSEVVVTVRDPGVGILGNADIRFEVAGRTIIPSPNRITNGTGEQEFGVALPMTGFTFPTVSCTVSPGVIGSRLGPVEVPITFTNITTGCIGTSTVLVNPPGANPCVQAPAQAAVTAPASGCATASAVNGASGSTIITFRNSAAAGSQALNVTAATPTGANAGEFTISPANVSVAPGGTQSFTVTFSPTAVGTRTANVAFTTNDPANSTMNVCLTGTSTAPAP